MIKYFTSESVTEGHPDKLCDRISDGILDAILEQDRFARVAVEACAAKNLLVIMGEVTTTAHNIDYEAIARDIIAKTGYTGNGFSAKSCRIIVSIGQQSADIALGVNNSLENKQGAQDEYDLIGAGDQGMMFGYACIETEELMPLPAMLSHKLCQRLAEVRKSGELSYLRPDGKGQVTVEYVDGVAKRVDAVVLSAQHDGFVLIEKLREDLLERVIKQVIPTELLDENTKYYINPTSRFEIGGPEGDTGLTGRKIIVDTYGGRCAHGGGCFSGKDATKVDRSATYMARYICKNCVAAGLADQLELQVSYAIGVAKPLSVFVDSFGTGKLSDDRLAEIIAKEFDLRPAAIIDKLDLRKPIYLQTAAYGHFGRPCFSWEQLDMVESLAKYLNK